VKATAKQVPTLGQETASVPSTPGGRVALRQRSGLSVEAAKPTIGQPPIGISIGHSSPIAQQLARTEHETLQTVPPGGSAGPVSNDQDRPASVETSTELVVGAAVKEVGTAMQ